MNDGGLWLNTVWLEQECPLNTMSFSVILIIAIELCVIFNRTKILSQWIHCAIVILFFFTILNEFPCINNSSVMRKKGESQNGCFKKTKHAKFSEKRKFVTPWYAHLCVRIRGKCSFFGKFGVLCLLETPVLRFALLPYYLRVIKRYLKKFLWKIFLQRMVILQMT